MPGPRIPGPQSQTANPLCVEDGTRPRMATPPPGPLGSSAGSVARMRPEQKLLVAAKRATMFLPEELQQQFAALFSAENLVITTAVFTAWAASHAFGIGEAIDVILLLVGAVTLGIAIGQCARDLAAFVSIAAQANSETELNEAAHHLARVVILIGVTAFVSLILKAGTKLRGLSAPAEEVGAEALWNQTIDRWLEVLGKGKAPPLVRQRLAVALQFFRERLPALREETAKGFLQGMDLSLDVQETTLTAGSEVVAYGDPNRLGLFYTKAGTFSDRLGIAAGNRQFMRFRVKESVRVLESRASGVADTWTAGRETSFSTGGKALVGGGGTQYIIPEASQYLELITKP